MLFCRLFPLVPPPARPLFQKNCCLKNYEESWCTNPPFMKSPQILPWKILPKWANNGVWVLFKVKKGPKRPSNGPKMAKDRWKGAKDRVVGPTIHVCFMDFLFAELWGTPPLFADSFTELWGTTPPPPILWKKHCQRHNGPEVWVYITNSTQKSASRLYLNLKSWPNLAS